MAIPIIIGAGFLVAGLYKGGKAVVDNGDANSINSSANSIVKQAESKLEKSKIECKAALTDLGQCKAEILEKNVQFFLQTFKFLVKR